MVRVSKNRLENSHLNQLLHQLTDVIGRLDSHQAHGFINEIFGKEEKEIFAKRLAIILMINEGRSLYSIARLLHVSDTTVGKIYDRFERGEFSNTIKALTKNKTDYKKFVDILDSILTVGGIMPHRNTPIRIPR